MSKHHDHSHGGHSHSHEHGHPQNPKGLKQHQVFMLIGVGLMLLAMVAYVLSLDEAIQPAGDGVGQEVPAETAAE